MPWYQLSPLALITATCFTVNLILVKTNVFTFPYTDETKAPTEGGSRRKSTRAGGRRRGVLVIRSSHFLSRRYGWVFQTHPRLFFNTSLLSRGSRVRGYGILFQYTRIDISDGQSHVALLLVLAQWTHPACCVDAGGYSPLNTVREATFIE